MRTSRVTVSRHRIQRMSVCIGPYASVAFKMLQTRTDFRDDWSQIVLNKVHTNNVYTGCPGFFSTNRGGLIHRRREEEKCYIKFPFLFLRLRCAALERALLPISRLFFTCRLNSCNLFGKLRDIPVHNAVVIKKQPFYYGTVSDYN